MTFYVLFSAVAILTAVVGCVVIWGYDVRRAERSAADVREATRARMLAGAGQELPDR